MDDRKKRRIGFLICIAFVIFIVTALLIVQITIGSHDLTIKADKDAYVYEYNPETNYGEDGDIFVGNYHGGKTEAYYHFDISSLPDGWRDETIHVNFDYGSDMVDVGCNISYESWGEKTITWNNKPNASFYFGHALCDGFDLNILIRSEDIINNEITICLYGRGGEDDGYIQGPSREGTTNYKDPPTIVLEYEGLGLDYLKGTIIAYAVIVIVIGLYLIIRKEFNFSPTPRTSMAMERLREHRLNEQRLHAQRLNELLSRRHRPPAPINRPLRGVRLQPSDFYKPIETFKINELVDLRLIGNRTYLFVNNKMLKICTFLLINIPKDRVRDYDEIKSIDEAAELLDRSLETTPPYIFKITPEEEFKAHCSNIQAFFENGLNTNILHTNIAFPLLKELVQHGFQPAQKVFKEEIAIRFNEGTFNSRRFLYLQGYLNYLSEEEKQVLKGYDDFVKKLPERSTNLRELFMRERLLNERQQPFRGILERENGRRIFNKIVIFGAPGVGKNTLNQRFLTRSGLDTRLTMGLNFGIKNVSVNNQPFELRTWNMASSEHFRTLSSLYFRGAIGGIFIYDITNQSSLTHIDDWLFSIRVAIRGGNRFPIIVVGNKSDLSETRKIPVNKAIELAKSRGMNGYIECSFRTGKNVEKIFERLVRIILKKERENT
ncbi:MAG: GTP-binding protein [Promethearchaeota archaeon]